MNWRKDRRYKPAVRTCRRLSDGICYLCGRGMDLSRRFVRGDPLFAVADHVIPASIGGALFDQENLKMTHKICNELKGEKLPTDINLFRSINLWWENFEGINSFEGSGNNWLGE